MMGTNYLKALKSVHYIILIIFQILNWAILLSMHNEFKFKLLGLSLNLNLKKGYIETSIQMIPCHADKSYNQDENEYNSEF